MRGREERRLGQAESSNRLRCRRVLFRRRRPHSAHARGQARPRRRRQDPSRRRRAVERPLSVQLLRWRFRHGSFQPGSF